jgi:serine/threonine protein kinase
MGSYFSSCCPSREDNTKRKRRKRKKITTSKTQTQKHRIFLPETQNSLTGNTEFDTDKPSLTPSRIPESKVTNEFTSPKGMTGESFECHKERCRLRGYELFGDLDKDNLGRGGFGVVLRAKVLKDNSEVAVKIMKLWNQKRTFERHPELFRDFSNEIFILRRNPNNNIIKLIDHFMYDSIHSYIVMEYAKGGSLSKKLKSRPKPMAFSESESKIYFYQMVRAIHYLHVRRIAHRDLKLDNVLIAIDENGNEIVKVSDFGVSRVAYKSEKGILMEERAVGTVPFMSPQMMRNYIKINLKDRTVKLEGEIRKYNPFVADMWALGVCLYLMLNRKFPFEYRAKKDDDLKVKVKAAYEMLNKQNRSHWKTDYSLINRKFTKICNQFLQDLLEVDKEKRITIDGALRYRWFDDILDQF